MNKKQKIISIAVSLIMVALICFNNIPQAKAEVWGGTFWRMISGKLSIFPNSTKMGIGSTSPYAKLSITGTAGQTNPLFEIASSTETPVFTVDASGNVVMTGTMSGLTFGSDLIVNSYNILTDGIMYASSTNFGNLIVSGTATSTFAGDIELADDRNVRFGSADNLGYSSAHGDLYYSGDEISVDSLTIYAGTGADASGLWTPFIDMIASSSITIQADGGIDDKVYLEGTDGVVISSRTSGAQAIYKDTYISGTNKIFEPPNISGILVVELGSQDVRFGQASTTQLSVSSNLFLGNATTTASNGFDISAGCFAVGGVCLTDTSPAGSNTEIQFNNSGAFGADSDFAWNTSGILSIGANDNTQALRINMLNQSGSGSSRIFFGESSLNYGYSMGYSPSGDTFTLKRHDNSSVGISIMLFRRANGNVDFGNNTTNMNLDLTGTLLVSSSESGNGDRFIVNSSGYVGIGTTTPTSELTVDGDITGNVYFGEMYMFNNATATVIALTDTYVKIGGDEVMVSGLLNGMTHSNGTTTVTNSGVYKASASISSSGGNAKEYHYTIAVNNAEQGNCHIARKMGTGGDVGAISVSCLLNLSASDVVTLMVENVDDDVDVTINNCNLTLEYIGLKQ